MPTALVTGVAGFIGSNLAHALLNDGYTARGVDNFETGRDANLTDLKDRNDFLFTEGGHL